MTRSCVALVLVVVLVGCEPEMIDDTVASGGGGGVGARTAGVVGNRALMSGSIVVAQAGKTAVVSHPDRDQVTVVDLRTRRVRARLAMPSGSVPARAVEDGSNLVHVVLRQSGSIATIGLDPPTLLGTRAVCPEPRGITWNATNRSLVVACASGELVTVPEDGSVTTRRFDTDLRDVVIGEGGAVRVSSFRGAELITIDTGDRVVAPTSSLPVVAGTPASFTPHVAWRTLQQGRRTVMVHQFEVDGDISAMSVGAPPPTAVVPYYANSCRSAIVRSAVSVFDDGRFVGSREIAGVLPMDATLSADGQMLFVVSAGSFELTRVPLGVVRHEPVALCGAQSRPPPLPGVRAPYGQPISVATTADGALLVHSRDPNLLIVEEADGETTEIPLGSSMPETAGQRLFHRASSNIACASCHPEGQEDGHVWTFFQNKRRTQALSGGLTATAPYHWEGDLKSMRQVIELTYVSRMGGESPSSAELSSLESMLGGVAAPRAPSREQPVDLVAGRAVFEKAACATCHSGPTFTNRATMNVGTGGAFQTPSLVGVASRGPWMHDGCAKTLEQRFTDTRCGGTSHGKLAPLSDAERRLLIDYLGQL